MEFAKISTSFLLALTIKNRFFISILVALFYVTGCGFIENQKTPHKARKAEHVTYERRTPQEKQMSDAGTPCPCPTTEQHIEQSSSVEEPENRHQDASSNENIHDINGMEPGSNGNPDSSEQNDTPEEPSNTSDAGETNTVPENVDEANDTEESSQGNTDAGETNTLPENVVETTTVVIDFGNPESTATVENPTISDLPYTQTRAELKVEQVKPPYENRLAAGETKKVVNQYNLIPTNNPVISNITLIITKDAQGKTPLKDGASMFSMVNVTIGAHKLSGLFNVNNGEIPFVVIPPLTLTKKETLTIEVDVANKNAYTSGTEFYVGLKPKSSWGTTPDEYKIVAFDSLSSSIQIPVTTTGTKNGGTEKPPKMVLYHGYLLVYLNPNSPSGSHGAGTNSTVIILDLQAVGQNVDMKITNIESYGATGNQYCNLLKTMGDAYWSDLPQTIKYHTWSNVSIQTPLDWTTGTSGTTLQIAPSSRTTIKLSGNTWDSIMLNCRSGTLIQIIIKSITSTDGAYPRTETGLPYQIFGNVLEY